MITIYFHQEQGLKLSEILVKEYIKKNDGKWPDSWEDLVNYMNSIGYNGKFICAPQNLSFWYGVEFHEEDLTILKLKFNI